MITKRITVAALVAALTFVGVTLAVAQQQQPVPPEETLFVVWHSGDADTFHHAIYWFTLNAQRFGWYQDVTLFVMGPAQKLLVDDRGVQKQVQEMRQAGVHVIADVDAAIDYDIEARLRALPVDVGITSPALATAMKRGARVLTM